MTQALTRSEAALSRAEQAALIIGRWAEQQEPGARLGTKKELQERVGVSKGTFNEAVRLLESRGLVSTRTGPGGGLFTVAPAPLARLGHALLALDDAAADVGHAVRIRNALDPLLIEDVVAHSSAADIARMRRSVAEMAAAMDAEDDLAFVRANWDLHAVIAAVTPNQPLRSIYLSLMDLIRTHTVAVEPDTDQPLRDYVHSRYQLHVDLVDALDRRDKAAAMRLAAEHSIQD
ncbi:FadR/GntR family transcriptional regulator [Kocuria rhizophila]|uniref:FadR/GntR family transcriptional regulator n=1 Tax=Kocuria rhizophila TaxID=72000 RepID=UPI00068D532E|nr:FCD domain-containing protein [Kocuria rhizophila]